MTRRTTTLLASAMGIALIAIVISLLLPTGQIQAQPRATLEAGSQAIQQTAAAAQTQVQELKEGGQFIQQTADAARQELQTGGTEIMATAEAVRTTLEAVGTNSANLATQVAGTAQYLATTINQDVADIQATATTISAMVQDRLAALPPEIAELITYLAEQASVQYDPAAGTLAVTSYVTEEQTNLLVDVLVEAGGYDPNSVWIDTRADSTVQVTLVDVTGDLKGTVVLTYQVVVTNGRADAILVGVTLNGTAVPPEMVPDELRSAVELAMAGAAQQVFVNLGQSSVNYTVESIIVSEDGFLVSYIVYVQ